MRMSKECPRKTSLKVSLNNHRIFLIHPTDRRWIIK